MQSYFTASLIVFLFLSMRVAALAETPSLIELRSMCADALLSEDVADRFHALMENADENRAMTLAYKAMADMMLSKHASMPWSKLKYFRQGRERLERALSMDRSNIELRFLRFTVQCRVPEFLGYHDNLEEDKGLLLSYLKRTNALSEDEDLYRRVLKHMLASEECTETEKASIRSLRQP